MTKLERIKQISPRAHQRRVYDNEDTEVAIAWLKDEIVYKSMEEVLKLSGSSLYSYLLMALKEAYFKKRLKIHD